MGGRGKDKTLERRRDCRGGALDGINTGDAVVSATRQITQDSIVWIG